MSATRFLITAPIEDAATQILSTFAPVTISPSTAHEILLDLQESLVAMTAPTASKKHLRCIPFRLWLSLLAKFIAASDIFAFWNLVPWSPVRGSGIECIHFVST